MCRRDNWGRVFSPFKCSTSCHFVVPKLDISQLFRYNFLQKTAMALYITHHMIVVERVVCLSDPTAYVAEGFGPFVLGHRINGKSLNP